MAQLELPPGAQIRVLQRMMDVYDERAVPEAVDEPVVIPFFVDDAGEWGRSNVDRHVCGVSVLQQKPGEGWASLAGAHVVIRIRKAELPIVDLLTAGDGRTITFPANFCGIPANEDFRIEVGLDQLQAGLIRCTISGIQQERI